MHCDATFYLHLASAGGTDISIRLINLQISHYKQHIKYKHINSSVSKELAKIKTDKRHSKLGPNISQHTLSPDNGLCQSIEWPQNFT